MTPTAMPEIQKAFYSLCGAEDPVQKQVKEIENLVLSRKKITRAQAEFYMKNRLTDKQRGVEAAKRDILDGTFETGLTLPLADVFGQEYADGYTEFVMTYKKMMEFAK